MVLSYSFSFYRVVDYGNSRVVVGIRMMFLDEYLEVSSHLLVDSGPILECDFHLQSRTLFLNNYISSNRMRVPARIKKA